MSARIHTVTRGATILALLLLPSISQAQGSQGFLAPHASPLFNTRPTAQAEPVFLQGPEPSPFDVASGMKSQPNHWLEGAIAGGTLLGLTGVLFAIDMCNPDSGTDNCASPIILGGLASAAVGAVVGAFVGKAFPKHATGDTVP